MSKHIKNANKLPSAGASPNLNVATLDMQKIRSRLLNQGLVYFAIVLPFALTLSLTRIFENGWNPIYIIHISVASLLVTGSIFRKRLPYKLRAYLLFGVFLVLGTFGLITFGLVGGGLLILVVFTLVVAIAFGTRAGLIACAIGLFFTASAGVAVSTGTITFSFDINEYAISGTAWLMLSTVFIVFVPVLVIALGVVHQQLAMSLQNLQESHANHQRLVDNLPGSFLYRKDIDGIFNYASSSVTQVLGYSTKEFFTHFSEFLTDHPVNQEIVKRTQQSIDGIQQPPYELQMYHKDESSCWLEVSETPVRDRDGKVVAIEGVAHDISERKKAEEEKNELESRLRQSQKMEAIGTLAGGIAHDFNNILAAVLGYTELAMADLPKESKTQKELREVFNAGQRAKELVKQILTFSRKSDQELRPLRTQLIAQEVIKLLRSSLPTTIEIKQNIDLGCKNILADPTQIHQVIMNFCTNAYHAMRETGGVLGISLQPVDLNHEKIGIRNNLKAGSYLKLMISDTGAGMTKDVQDQIFVPYFTTKNKGEGTGLGLAVVHGIVNSLQGDITVYSEPGKGTTFHVYLPIVEEAKKTVHKEVTKPLPIGNERILLVDDDEVIVRMGRKILEKQGFRVTALTSSMEALHTFQKTPDNFDLIITDMTMPEMTGADLAKLIFAIRPGMPIILCTGYSEIINEEQAKSLGIRDYVMKPVVKYDFIWKVREILDGEVANLKNKVQPD